MSNIKLKDHNWATDGIYDTNQSKTQKTINSDVNTIIGSTSMGTTATTLTGAVKEINTKIGSTSMGTTATTLTGAVKETNTKIAHYNSRGAIDISDLTNAWLMNADDGEYQVNGSSATGTFLEGIDHTYGILKVVHSQDWVSGLSPYGYILYFANSGNVYHREFRRDAGAISWRTDIKRIANYEDKINKIGDTYTGALVYKTDGYTSGTAPSSNQYKSFFELSDAANNHLVIFQGTSYTTGEEGFEIVARRNQNGTWRYNSLRLLMDSSFNQQVFVTNSEPWRKALGLCYAANDTFSTYAGAAYVGVITHSSGSSVGDELIFDVEVPKSMENISTITVTSMSGGMRGANGWIDFQGNKNWASLSGYTVTGTRIDNNRVRVVVLKANKASFAYVGGSNLPAESLASYWGGITFKFT